MRADEFFHAPGALSMNVSDLDRGALARALDDHDPDREHYLALEDGSVWTFVFSGATDETRERRDVVLAGLGTTYLRIPSRTPQEAFEEIEDFVEGMSDPKAQDQLFVALERRGAFRNFREALLRHPDEHRRWRERRREASRCRLAAFLATLGIEERAEPAAESG
jgi:hypothetical protein